MIENKFFVNRLSKEIGGPLRLKEATCFFCTSKIHEGVFVMGKSADKSPDISLAVCGDCIKFLGMLAGVAWIDQSEQFGRGDPISSDEEISKKLINEYWHALAKERLALIKEQLEENSHLYNVGMELLGVIESELDTTSISEAKKIIQSLKNKDEYPEGQGWIYLILRQNGDYKIGLSNNVDRRLEQIKKDHPKARLVHKITADDMRQAEAMLHEEFVNKRQDGEWFSLTPEDVELIIRRVRFEDGWFLERYDNLPVKDEDERKKSE